jgi:hypothetical protein
MDQQQIVDLLPHRITPIFSWDKEQERQIAETLTLSKPEVIDIYIKVLC